MRRPAAAVLIHRAAARVVRFPSSVPPGRILSEYAQVVDRGRVEESPA
jgi:hypothetical protein